jgi:hypothetical protein
VADHIREERDLFVGGQRFGSVFMGMAVTAFAVFVGMAVAVATFAVSVGMAVAVTAFAVFVVYGFRIEHGRNPPIGFVLIRVYHTLFFLQRNSRSVVAFSAEIVYT